MTPDFDHMKTLLDECMAAAGLGALLRETEINETTRVFHWQRGSLTLRLRDSNHTNTKENVNS